MNIIVPDEAEAALVDAFRRSPEYTAARLPFRPLWVIALLDCMTAADWSWSDLGLPQLRALLCEGMGWTIDEPPRNPAAVARELDAFLRWAGRTRGYRHAGACCRWLRTETATRAIARQLRPRRGKLLH
jgi:hypothetical protein